MSEDDRDDIPPPPVVRIEMGTPAPGPGTYCAQCAIAGAGWVPSPCAVHDREETAAEAITRQLAELEAVAVKASAPIDLGPPAVRDTGALIMPELDAQQAIAAYKLREHPLLVAVASMNRTQRKAFEAVLKRQNAKGRQAEGLAPCFAAAEAAGWRGQRPPVRMVKKDAPEVTLHALDGGPPPVTPKELVLAHESGRVVTAKVRK